MGIFEKPKKSGIWHVSYCDRTGQRHREKVGGKLAAMNTYSQRRSEIREGRYVTPKQRRAFTFSALAASSLEQKRIRSRPRTYLGECQRLQIVRKASPVFCEMNAAEINPPTIEHFLANLQQDRKLSGSSINRYRTFISGIFTHGVAMGHIPRNPVSKIRRWKENDSRIRWLLPEEEARLRNVIRLRCSEREAEIDLALWTGMRRSEQFTLKWSDVDLEQGQLTVFGKMGRRFITLSEKAKAAIRVLASMRPLGAVYVCRETKNDDQRDWRIWFENAVKEAEIVNFRWHDLRHTFASRLVMAGVHLLTVKELMGHRSIVMTERYSHLALHHRKEAVEKI